MDKLTNDEAVDILVTEGIDSIVNYISGHRFEDPVTVNLWTSASDAINELISYLETTTARPLDEE